MLTSRGWWLLIVLSLQVVLGVIAIPTWSVTPAVVGLALLAWFGFEWAAFHWRLNSAVSQLRITRRIVQGEREVPMVWAGVHFTVRVEIGYESGARVPYVFLEDRLPSGMLSITGDAEASTALQPGVPVVLEYDLRCPTLGLLRFEGVRLRVTDLHGFFYHRLFFREGAEYLVLPRLSDDEGRQRADKRFNTLPPPGIHRLRRPGTGSELLDLRDYRAGDPPKMIAWKASARRDRLITKEFESDVPVRCVLFLDASEGVRLGPPGESAIVKLASLASGVAQAAAANRDLVGLTIFDEDHAEILPPARTQAHLITLLQRLALAASRMPEIRGVLLGELTRRGTQLARTVYPDWTARGVNSMPMGRHWIPLLDTRWGWLALVWLLATPVLVIQKEWLRETAAAAWAAKPDMRSGLVRFSIFLVIWFCFAFSPALIALAVWFIHGARGWFNPRRSELTNRKRLAAVLALRDNTGPAGIERLIHDDEAYSEAIGRFLTEHRVRCPSPLYDETGRYRYRGVRKIETLSNALIQAVGRARDNELYVVLADLVELGPDLSQFVKAARVARSRHHQVLVIVPWPAEVAEPTDEPPVRDYTKFSLSKIENRETRSSRKKPKPQSARERLLAYRSAVQKAFDTQFHHAYHELRRELGKAGVTMVRVHANDAVQVVLDRLDRLRGMRTRR